MKPRVGEGMTKGGGHPLPQALRRPRGLCDLAPALPGEPRPRRLTSIGASREAVRNAGAVLMQQPETNLRREEPAWLSELRGFFAVAYNDLNIAARYKLKFVTELTAQALGVAPIAITAWVFSNGRFSPRLFELTGLSDQTTFVLLGFIGFAAIGVGNPVLLTSDAGSAIEYEMMTGTLERNFLAPVLDMVSRAVKTVRSASRAARTGGKIVAGRKLLRNMSGVGALEDFGWGWIGFNITGRGAASLPIVRVVQGVQGHVFDRRGKARLIPGLIDLLVILTSGGIKAGKTTAVARPLSDAGRQLAKIFPL